MKIAIVRLKCSAMDVIASSPEKELGCLILSASSFGEFTL
jgi:hypothetical protein